MLKVYFITIITFYLSFLLTVSRILVNKNKIKLEKNKEKYFVYVRLIVMGIIPVVNIVFTIMWLYFSIFMNHEKFIEFMNEES